MSGAIKQLCERRFSLHIDDTHLKDDHLCKSITRLRSQSYPYTSTISEHVSGSRTAPDNSLYKFQYKKSVDVGIKDNIDTTPAIYSQQDCSKLTESCEESDRSQVNCSSQSDKNILSPKHLKQPSSRLKKLTKNKTSSDTTQVSGHNKASSNTTQVSGHNKASSDTTLVSGRKVHSDNINQERKKAVQQRKSFKKHKSVIPKQEQLDKSLSHSGYGSAAHGVKLTKSNVPKGTQNKRQISKGLSVGNGSAEEASHITDQGGRREFRYINDPEGNRLKSRSSSRTVETEYCSAASEYSLDKKKEVIESKPVNTESILLAPSRQSTPKVENMKALTKYSGQSLGTDSRGTFENEAIATQESKHFQQLAPAYKSTFLPTSMGTSDDEKKRKIKLTKSYGANSNMMKKKILLIRTSKRLREAPGQRQHKANLAPVAVTKNEGKLTNGTDNRRANPNGDKASKITTSFKTRQGVGLKNDLSSKRPDNPQSKLNNNGTSSSRQSGTSSSKRRHVYPAKHPEGSLRRIMMTRPRVKQGNVSAEQTKGYDTLGSEKVNDNTISRNACSGMSKGVGSSSYDDIDKKDADPNYFDINQEATVKSVDSIDNYKPPTHVMKEPIQNVEATSNNNYVQTGMEEKGANIGDTNVKLSGESEWTHYLAWLLLSVKPSWHGMT